MLPIYFLSNKCNFLNLKAQVTSLDENSDTYQHRNPCNVPGNICIISSDKSSQITSSSCASSNDNRNNVSKVEPEVSSPSHYANLFKISDEDDHYNPIEEIDVNECIPSIHNIYSPITSNNNSSVNYLMITDNNVSKVEPDVSHPPHYANLFKIFDEDGHNANRKTVLNRSESLTTIEKSSDVITETIQGFKSSDFIERWKKESITFPQLKNISNTIFLVNCDNICVHDGLNKQFLPPL